METIHGENACPKFAGNATVKFSTKSVQCIFIPQLTNKGIQISETDARQ